MEIVDRPVLPFRRRLIVGFAALFLALYATAAGIAEVKVGRAGSDTAFQRLLSLQGQKIDWVVLGASHALPLAYGDIPQRLTADSGQSMAVLAEVGAGPVYNAFVFQQAMHDIAPRRLLYVVDSFAFTSPDWNEARIGDRKLLRKTPLRLSTGLNMAGLVAARQAKVGALIDYLTAFSKLNSPDRFPQPGWRGAADFDRTVRLSRHAVQSRMAYLYPATPQEGEMARYLDILMTMFDNAKAAGIEVVVMKPPLLEAFQSALPDEDSFDLALQNRLTPRGIRFYDLSAALSDPDYFFDTDHLNRTGVDSLYDEVLLEILAP